MVSNVEEVNEFSSLQAVFGKYFRNIESDIRSAISVDDIKNSDEILDMIGTFIILPLTHMKSTLSVQNFEDGNRIIAPDSLSTILLSRSSKIASAHFLQSSNEPSVLKIQSVKNPSLYTHCAILEFSAEDGIIYAPNCILKHLQITEDDISSSTANQAILSHAQLLRGSFAQFQPDLQSFFTDIKDCKPLLESTLKRYQCLTIGDRIRIKNDNERKSEDNKNQNEDESDADNSYFYLEVKQVMSAWNLGECEAIHIINTDIITEFIPAKDFIPVAFENIEATLVAVDENTNITVKEVQTAKTEDANINKFNKKKPTSNDGKYGGRGKSLTKSTTYGSGNAKKKKKRILEEGDGFSFIYEVDEDGNKKLLRKIPKRKLPF